MTSARRYLLAEWGSGQAESTPGSLFASLVVVQMRQFGRVNDHQGCEVGQVGRRGLQ
jgi:hypothetical protein